MATITPFWSQKLFEKSDKVRISYEGIARKCCVTPRSAKNYIKRDIESGLIIRKKNKYTHPIFKRVCDGRNTYILTKEGRDKMRKKPPSKPPGPSSGEKKEWQLLFDLKQMGSLSEIKRFSQPASQLPTWWFKDPSLLEKTLILLKKKIEKGYKVRSPIRWISSALKDFGCGYRQKVAQEVSLHLNHPDLLKCCSEPVHQFYHRLHHLKGRGLDTSVPSLLKLLRRGFAHLGDALYAMDKLLKYSVNVNNLTAFLNYLVSLKDPHIIYKVKKPLQDCLEKAKTFLREKASSLQFVNKKSLPEIPEREKTYLQFLIHKTFPEKSLIRVFQFTHGLWKEKRLKIGDPLFTKTIQTLVCHP